MTGTAAPIGNVVGEQSATLRRVGVWLPIAIGIAVLASFVLTLERAPLPWKDEIYDASAVLSIVGGGTGVPTVLPPGTWESFPRVYGPAYFWIATALARAHGVTPAAVRLPCVLGAVLIAAGAGWLALAATGSTGWAAASFAIVAAAPDLAIVATNGRVDALAIGAAMLGLAALVDAVGRPSARVAYGLATLAGCAWAMSLLASPRVLPWFGAIAVVSPGVLWLPKDQRARVMACIVIAAALACVSHLAWTVAAGWGPIGRLNYLRHATDGDWFDVVLPGGRRTLGLYLRPGATFVSAVLGAALVVFSTSSDAAGRLARLAFWGAVLTLTHWLVTGNNVLFHGAYFTLPLLATSLAVTPAARLRRTALVAWAAIATLFVAIAVGKDVEIVQSWTASDPRPLQAFLERQVPAGSLVFGPDSDYFYAVEAAQSSFRTILLVPFPAPGFGHASVPNVFAGTEAARRFVLWPADGALPGDLPCRLAEPVATFRPPRREGALARFVALYARQHGFVETALFAVPPGCGSDHVFRASER